MAMTVDERVGHSTRIAANLDVLLSDLSGRIVSAYWPLRGEPDLRPWMASVIARGARCALPVVVAKAAPLVFRAWQPGSRMARGVWDIPIPADDGAVTPDILIAPVVGYDRECYRLGYGGGYFDRTLASRFLQANAQRPRVLGVGYAHAALATIHPQSYDIPMDVVVTEGEILRPAGAVSPTPQQAMD